MAKGTRRKKGRRRGATARANAELGAHLASLGLAAIEAYKVWCRQHGFSAALSKTWQERRQERVAHQRDQRAAQATQALQQHVERLGLDGVAAYQAWCRQQGIGDAMYKKHDPAQQGTQAPPANSEYASLACGPQAQPAHQRPRRTDLGRHHRRGSTVHRCPALARPGLCRIGGPRASAATRSAFARGEAGVQPARRSPGPPALGAGGGQYLCRSTRRVGAAQPRLAAAPSRVEARQPQPPAAIRRAGPLLIGPFTRCRPAWIRGGSAAGGQRPNASRGGLSTWAAGRTSARPICRLCSPNAWRTSLPKHRAT